MLVAVAYALDGGNGAAPSPIAPLMPLIIIFAIFYFLLIRPQQKKVREHSKFIESLKVGDDVLTAGGIFGKVARIDDDRVIVEIADKVKVSVLKSQLYEPSRGKEK